jgi:hypothetical protein
MKTLTRLLDNHALRRAARYAAMALVLWAAPLAAQESVPAYEQPPNLLLRATGTFLVIAVLWLIFYKAASPFFLRYYRSDFCRTIFWTLFSLYSLTWLLLASYLIFDIGFYLFWMKWVAVFLAVLWFISGLLLLVRRTPA